MMKLEIEEPDSDGWRSWTVFKQTEDGDVSIRYDYQKPGEERKTWQDSGATLHARDLPKIISWLSQLSENQNER